jgi:hypothetical protein
LRRKSCECLSAPRRILPRHDTFIHLSYARLHTQGNTLTRMRHFGRRMKRKGIWNLGKRHDSSLRKCAQLNPTSVISTSCHRLHSALSPWFASLPLVT